MRSYHGQGVDGWDVDLPTRLEASYICNLAAKLVWATWYIAVYGLRPIIIKPKPVGAHPAPAALPGGCRWSKLAPAQSLQQCGGSSRFPASTAILSSSSTCAGLGRGSAVLRLLAATLLVCGLEPAGTLAS